MKLVRDIHYEFVPNFLNTRQGRHYKNMCIANSPVKCFPVSSKVRYTLLLSLCTNERNMSKMIKVCWNC